MNIYKILHVPHGIATTTIVHAMDISQAIYQVNITDVIRVELVGTQEVKDTYVG